MEMKREINVVRQLKIRVTNNEYISEQVGVVRRMNIQSSREIVIGQKKWTKTGIRTLLSTGNEADFHLLNRNTTFLSILSTLRSIPKKSISVP